MSSIVVFKVWADAGIDRQTVRQTKFHTSTNVFKVNTSNWKCKLVMSDKVGTSYLLSQTR